jgi:hypothetical protein
VHAAIQRKTFATPRLRVDPFTVGRAVAVTGLAVVVAASFGPWLRSGERVRSSYELFQVVDRLGFLGDGVIRWLPRLWVCVPLLAALALALYVVGRPRIAAAATAVVGGAALLVGVGLQAAPLPAEWGSRLAAAGGAAALLGAAVTIVITPPTRGAANR